MGDGTADSTLFDARLAQVAEIARNGRATWFTLLLTLIFAAITLAAVRDADFFRLGAGATLPLVGVTIPTYAFFIAAPLLLLALHCYFHLYLMKLWRGLRAAGDAAEGRALDEVVWPWLIADAAILTMPGAPRRTLGVVTQAVSIALGWLATPVVLLLFWVRSWPPHDEWLSLFVLATALMALAASGLSLILGRAVLRGDGDVDRSGWLGETPLWAQGLFLTAAAGLTAASWERTEGGLTRCRDVTIQFGWCGEDKRGDVLIPLYPAQLRGAELVERPPDWRPRAEARGAFLADWSGLTREKVATLLAADPPPDWLAAADAAFDADRTARIQRLAKPDLSEGRTLFGAFFPAPAVDLRNADLRGAFMTGLNLTGARMGGADMEGASIEEAALTRADLVGGQCDLASQYPDLYSAIGLPQPSVPALRCTSLELAHAERASFDNANLTGTQLVGAILTKSSLRETILISANITLANLTSADLTQANLTNSTLSRAVLIGAIIGDATLVGADLVGAIVTGARLRKATLTRADLRGTTLTNAKFDLALAPNADFRGSRNLDLAGAIGDRTTLISPVAVQTHLLSCYKDEPTGLLIGDLVLIPPMADRAGMPPDEFRARFVCSPDNPQRIIWGPDLRYGPQ